MDDDELDPAPRAGDGDVQAPLTAFPVERSEVHRELAVLVAAVADAEDHDVTLVALDVLQVLDEEAVEAVFGEERVELRRASRRRRSSATSMACCLGFGERDDAERHGPGRVLEGVHEPSA